MASTYAPEGEAAPSQAEFGAFANAMLISYGAPLELFSIDSVSGAQVVLADTSVTNLPAELPVLETEADGVNLGLQLADGVQIGFAKTPPGWRTSCMQCQCSSCRRRRSLRTTTIWTCNG